MSQLLDRVPVDGRTASGLLRAEHFQMAYVTTDLVRACALFTQQLGIREFAALGGPLPAGGQIQTRLAWVGTLMYELIHASGPGSEIYQRGLPGDGGFVIRHHHLGFLAHDQQQWDGVLAGAQRHGCTVLYRNVNPLVEVCFLEVPHMPHLLEYLKPTPQGLQFFRGVPRT